MTNNARTVKAIEAKGGIAQVVERWNAFSKTRKDLFGFVDIVAIINDSVIFIQCTSRDNMSSRIKKIHDSAYFENVMFAVQIEVWGWKKIKNRWQVKVTSL